MIDELLKECQELLGKLTDEENRESEIHLIYGLWTAIDGIECQILKRNYDSSIEDCLNEIKDALQLRLECVLARKWAMKKVL